MTFPKNVDELNELLRPDREKAAAERVVVEAAKAFVLTHGPSDGFLKDYDPLCDAVEALERAEEGKK